jgi:hypothetical protein
MARTPLPTWDDDHNSLRRNEAGIATEAAIDQVDELRARGPRFSAAH